LSSSVAAAAQSRASCARARYCDGKCFERKPWGPHMGAGRQPALPCQDPQHVPDPDTATDNNVAAEHIREARHTLPASAARAIWPRS
jgi:hypothetical protein